MFSIILFSLSLLIFEETLYLHTQEHIQLEFKSFLSCLKISYTAEVKNNLVQGFQNNWICPWFVCRHRWLRETHLQTLNLPGRPVAGCASPALTGRLWDWSEHRYTLKGKTETMHRSLTEWRHIMGLRLDSQMEEKLKKGAWTIPSDVILGGWYDFSWIWEFQKVCQKVIKKCEHELTYKETKSMKIETVYVCKTICC